MKSLAILLGIGLLTWPLAAQAGGPHVPPPPPRGPAPLLFVRIGGPAGLQTGFFQPGAGARIFPAPAAFGLRPGYVYQVALTGLPVRPDHPEAPGVLYPTFEVRGSVAI